MASLLWAPNLETQKYKLAENGVFKMFGAINPLHSGPGIKKLEK